MAAVAEHLDVLRFARSTAVVVERIPRAGALDRRLLHAVDDGRCRQPSIAGVFPGARTWRSAPESAYPRFCKCPHRRCDFRFTEARPQHGCLNVVPAGENPHEVAILLSAGH